MGCVTLPLGDTLTLTGLPHLGIPLRNPSFSFYSVNKEAHTRLSRLSVRMAPCFFVRTS